MNRLNSLGIVEIIDVGPPSALSSCLRFGTTEQLLTRRSVTDMWCSLSYDLAGSFICHQEHWCRTLVLFKRLSIGPVSFLAFINEEFPARAIRPWSILAEVSRIRPSGFSEFSSVADQMAEMPFTVSTEKNKAKASIRESCFQHYAEQKMPGHRWQGAWAVLGQSVTAAMAGHQTVALHRTLLHFFLHNLC